MHLLSTLATKHNHITATISMTTRSLLSTLLLQIKATTVTGIKPIKDTLEVSKAASSSNSRRVHISHKREATLSIALQQAHLQGKAGTVS